MTIVLQIVDLTPDDEVAVHQAAAILLDCFGHLPSGYPTLERAIEEVRESLSEDRISRIAVDEYGYFHGKASFITRIIHLQVSTLPEPPPAIVELQHKQWFPVSLLAIC